MKLVTLRTNDTTAAARLEDDEVIVLPFSDVGELLSSGTDLQHVSALGGERRRLDEVDLAPTILNPSKIFCLGLNYLDHIEEFGRNDRPAHPTLFAKFSAVLTGPRDKIMLPRASSQVDWEVELVIVIGQRVRNANERQAVEAIAGYAVGNDVSMRDWQNRTRQWLQGKTWEASSPLGPMVTRDEIGTDGHPDLAVICSVDGTVMQSSRTKYLLFNCIEIVSYVSTIMTLQPGDLIFTGTCSGVGAARTPPVFIQPGQVVTTTIEGIGECRNEFFAE